MTQFHKKQLRLLRDGLGLHVQIAQSVMDQYADKPQTRVYQEARRRAEELIRMKNALEQMMTEMGIRN